MIICNKLFNHLTFNYCFVEKITKLTEALKVHLATSSAHSINSNSKKVLFTLQSVNQLKLHTRLKFWKFKFNSLISNGIIRTNYFFCTRFFVFLANSHGYNVIFFRPNRSPMIASFLG